MSSPATGGTRDGLAAGDRATPRRHLALEPAVGAGQQVVVLQLEAADADAVDVGPADHAAAGLAAGQDPLALGVDVDAGQPERRDLLADRLVDLARDVHETGRLGDHRRDQLGPLLVRPSTLVRIAAVPSGSSISLGLMLMLFAGTDIASSSPLRSKIVPRSAGTSRERVHWRVALDAQRLALARLQDRRP